MQVLSVLGAIDVRWLCFKDRENDWIETIDYEVKCVRHGRCW